MAVTDPIADYLTRIRNAQQAGHKVVEIPSSSMKRKITEILYDQGYILKYKFEDKSSENPQGVIKIAIKYLNGTKEPVIRELGRLSKPGLRKYAGASGLPRIIEGLGIAIVSTSSGIMTARQAKEQKIGGELICYVY
jgi:small subunit ribosomal protein S8